MQHIGRYITFFFALLLTVFVVIAWTYVIREFDARILASSIIMTLVSLGFDFFVIKDIIYLIHLKNTENKGV